MNERDWLHELSEALGEPPPAPPPAPSPPSPPASPVVDVAPFRTPTVESVPPSAAGRPAHAARGSVDETTDALVDAFEQLATEVSTKLDRLDARLDAIEQVLVELSQTNRPTALERLAGLTKKSPRGG